MNLFAIADKFSSTALRVQLHLAPCRRDSFCVLDAQTLEHIGQFLGKGDNQIDHGDSAGLGDALGNCDLLIVGAGFYGRLPNGWRELGSGALIDRRLHIGGKAYTENDPDTGIEVHKYGAHLFHTSNPIVWKYLRRFTEFTDYRHRVFTSCREQVYAMPIKSRHDLPVFRPSSFADEAKALIAEQATELGGDCWYWRKRRSR